MKIGIDLRWIAFGESGGPTPWLHGPLSVLLTRDGPHTYVLFHTVFNYHLFPTVGPNVIRRTLPVPLYYQHLQDQVTFEGNFDLILRCAPDGVLDRFPLDRQIVCFPGCYSAANREQRKVANLYQTSVGAIAVPTPEAERTLRADPWTTINDVFVLPAEGGAEELLAAFERVCAGNATSHVWAPVVSIVTPSFNQGGFIRQTIDSVLSQDYPHIDYQVIDGGSTDGTIGILKSYGDRLRWVSEKDRGQTHAINKGMATARGEIRAYLNSDDLLRPGAVSRVVRHFRERPACDLVYGRDAFIDADGCYIGSYLTADYSFERLVECCCISQPATFWRARLADRVGPFDESLYLVMDYDYWLRADRAGGTLEHIPEVLAHTRIHRDAKSSGSGQAESHQRRYYRELFAVSNRHAGYVSSHYVHSWLRAAVFNAHPWTKRHEELITRVVQTWYHNRYRRGKNRLRALLSVLAGERPHVLPFLRRQYSVLNPRGLFRSKPLPPVELGPDLWLGPELTVAHPGGPVRLAGVPVASGVLRVSRGSAEVAVVELHAGEPADVCVEIPGPGPVRLTFSDSELLPDGRRVSFQLHGTTLFTERAVA